ERHDRGGARGRARPRLRGRGRRGSQARRGERARGAQRGQIGPGHAPRPGPRGRAARARPQRPGGSGAGLDRLARGPEPHRGRAVVIEGLGFGAVQGGGAVTFARAGGGADVTAPVASPADWSDQVVRTTVPDSAVSGTLALTTAGGRRLTATVHVLPHVVFS